MIRVNLTKTRITSIGTDAGATGLSSSSGGSGGGADIFIKLLLLLGLAGGLMVYEYINISNLERELNELTIRSNQLTAELATKQELTAPLKEIEDKAKELEDKLNIMKKLSRLRLRTVKALDFIQTSIPDRLWFNSIKFNENKVNLQGYAATDDDLSTFTKAIENSILFTNVLIVRSEMTKMNNAEFKVFEMNCNSEVSE